MPRHVNLFDFVQFASKSGGPKLTKAREIKKSAVIPYDPKKDFYKPLRDHMIETHTKGLPKGNLDKLLPALQDIKKIKNYPAVIDAYKKWWGSRQLTWFKPASARFQLHGFDIPVSPELGLVIGGSRYLVKLYMRSEPLLKVGEDLIPHLMNVCLAGKPQSGTQMAVLDVRRGKFIAPTTTKQTTNALVNGELAYLAAVWSTL